MDLKVQQATEALKEVEKVAAKANKEAEEKKEREEKASARSNSMSVSSRARLGAAGVGLPEQRPEARNLPSQPSPRASARRPRKPLTQSSSR